MDNEKYFFIYLLTNSHTKQCGIYELPKIIMTVEISLDENTVDYLIKKFVEGGKLE